jgi:hypothetical protein
MMVIGKQVFTKQKLFACKQGKNTAMKTLETYIFGVFLTKSVASLGMYAYRFIGIPFHNSRTAQQFCMKFDIWKCY